MEYKKFIETCIEVYNDKGIRYKGELIKNMGDEELSKLKEAIKNKKKFIELYYSLSGLDLKKNPNFIEALNIKIENDKKSITNNPKYNRKEENLERIDNLQKEYIEEYELILKDKWDYENKLDTSEKLEEVNKK